MSLFLDHFLLMMCVAVDVVCKANHRSATIWQVVYVFQPNQLERSDKICRSVHPALSASMIGSLSYAVEPIHARAESVANIVFGRLCLGDRSPF